MDGAPRNPSDEMLIGRVALGDKEAFAALYDRHAVAAFSLARRMLGTERAEDAVQEGFLAVWRGASGYRPGRGTVRPWLLRIVHNRCLDALRRADVRERRTIDVPDFDSQTSDEHVLVDDVFEAVRNQRVAAALRLLPSHQRLVVELAYFEGLSQTEIAGRLGVPLGTVKGRARLALGRLARSLADERPVGTA